MEAKQLIFLFLQQLARVCVFYTRHCEAVICRSTTSITEMVLHCHLMAELETEHNASYFSFGRSYLIHINVGQVEE